MNWTTALVSLASALAVAVVTSHLTVRLALRRFYSEKWWERKSAAYTAIIESMHHLREHADTNFVFETKDRKLPPEGEELLDRNLRQAMADLRKHRDIGSFVISGGHERRRGAEQQTRFVEGFVRGAVGADKVRFDGLLDHSRAIAADAEMFDPKDRRKIATKADKLWTELRNARKRQVLAGLG